jgi:hypothetical protein
MRQWRRVFGTPWSPTPAEVVDAQAIADAIRKPGDASPSAHMGEAEAIAVLVSRGINAVFLTDDYDAARAAARYPLIGVASTTKILALAEAAGRIRHGEARTHLATLLSAGRVLGNYHRSPITTPTSRRSRSVESGPLCGSGTPPVHGRWSQG